MSENIASGAILPDADPTIRNVRNRVCGIIPCYNESERIAGVVSGALRSLPLVIVVDDCSSDGTSRAAAEAGASVLRHETNRGKGAALKTGFAEAARLGFEAAVTLDGDGQHDPAEIPLFLKAYADGECDIVLGCRRFERGRMPAVRRYTNTFTSWAISRMSGRRISDSQTGFRLIRLKTWQAIHLTSDRFDLESEFLIKAGRMGARIREVPISTIYAGEKSKINPLKDTYRFFSILWRCRR